MTTTYRTFGEALADPTTSISKFVAQGKQAMSHNPRGSDEWAEYLAWQAGQAQQGNRDFSTETWRANR